ncbi:hypothetical protein [Roseomonas populi]|uniref:Uncharacterized protein n=1 Tax=Roseomonas populi TaxID=3121582 RepID=A0ABT1X1I1_9PROT|nr:hypothetical protein [Roseomonas pecuniae]MCR0981957.1 hypothetical protein [Roseomonas pecuniae]
MHTALYSSLHTLRGPNLSLSLLALALVVTLLVMEHVVEWPFPLYRETR